MACSLTTGSVPGSPNDSGSTAVLGAASTLSTTGQALNILLWVNNSAWISKPITGFQSLMVMGCSPMGCELVYNVGEIVPRKWEQEPYMVTFEQVYKLAEQLPLEEQMDLAEKLRSKIPHK